MEIKATLLKPYSGSQKYNFIKEHSVGFEIKETATAIEAWGYTTEEQAEQEKERVNNLTMTPLDFIKALAGLGLTLEEINNYLEAHLDIKMQLTYCNSVYCGVVKSFLPIEIAGVELTEEMIEQAFKNKNGI